MEGTNIWSDTWLRGLNQTINNMTGPMPFTPRFEFKINGNYTIPKIEVDLGLRFRLHTGRPVWYLSSIRQLDPYNMTELLKRSGRIGRSSSNQDEGQIVAQDPTKPWYMPILSILDLRLEKGDVGRGNIRAMLDGSNISQQGRDQRHGQEGSSSGHGHSAQGCRSGRRPTQFPLLSVWALCTPSDRPTDRISEPGGQHPPGSFLFRR